MCTDFRLDVGTLWITGPGRYHRAMPDPSLIIWGVIAIAVVLLWPIRNWIRSRYDRDDPGDD